MLDDQFLNVLAEIGLQTFIVFDAVRLHELLNLGIRVPLFAIHFVAADMEILIGEKFRHFGNEIVEEFVSLLVGGIHRGIGDAPLLPDLVRAGPAGQFGIANEPCGAVAGHVELGDYANAAIAGIGNQVANFILGVIEAVGALLLQFRKFVAFDAEPLIVGKVPVEDVDLYGFHSVQITFQHRQRNEMARDIDHQATPRETRLILDANGRRRKSIRGDRDELQEGLQAVH